MTTGAQGPDTFEGYVDDVAGRVVRGWAWASNRPNTPIAVDILADGFPIATIIAGTFRGDLELAGKGDGRHAFEFEAPDRWSGCRLTARIANTDKPLTVVEPEARYALARTCLRGDGLEIGALHNPLRMPPGARVRYVDRMRGDALREHYPELAAHPLVEVDIVADGETLEPIADKSVDFVVANHFLEHAEDPIQTVRTFLRVLKPGGVLFMAVPDKRFTFDVDREVTPFEHILRDHREGPAWSRGTHYQEWARHVEHRASEAEVARRAQALDAQRYSIHFHVWTQDGLREAFTRLRAEVGLPLVLERCQQNAAEVLLIIRPSP